MDAYRLQNVPVMEILIAAGANVNRQSKRGNTALIQGVRYDHIMATELLIAAGADPNIQNNDGHTALFTAAQRSHVNIINVLMAAGADINIRDHKEGTTLMEVVKLSTELFLKWGANPHIIDNNGNTPLINAVKYWYPDTIKILLDSDADLNHQNNEGNTALILATDNWKVDINVVKTLLDANADVNRSNKRGNTALTGAVKNGHTEVVKLLLKTSAHINHKNTSGDTPLILAVRIRNEDIVKLLLEAHPHINEPNNAGNTMLFYVTEDYPKWWDQIFIEDILNLDEIDVHHVNNNGQTALFMVPHSMAVFLLEKGADVNHRDYDGETALFYTSQLDKAELLIKYGLDIHHRDDDGRTVGHRVKKSTNINMLYRLGVPLPAEVVDWIHHDQEFVDAIIEQVGYTDPHIDPAECYENIKDEYSWRLARWILVNSQTMLNCCPEAKEYTHEYDIVINDLLRHHKGTWNAETHRVVHDVYRALEETTPLPEDTTVYRGLKPYGNVTFDNIPIGYTMDMKGFSSFTIDPTIAKKFSSRAKDGMVLKARFPMGLKALFLEKNFETSYYPEKELITYPNLQFQVTAKYDDDSYHIIEVELVTTGQSDMDNILAETGYVNR